MTWMAVLLGAAGCYALKLAGLSLPRHLLAGRRLNRIAEVVPIALLAALVGLQAFTSGTRLTLDARALGVAVAVLAVLARAPFLVVVAAAVTATALLRLWH